MELYARPKQDALKTLNSTEGGLSEEEAERRLAAFGKNELKEGKRRSIPALFFAQFKDLMTLILVAAAVLSGVLAYVTGDRSELTDTAILLFIIVLNAAVGVVQQYRADSAIEKLRKLSTATAKVVRGGRVRLLPAALLVPGDVVEIEEGDRIPADCRILSSEGVKCDEAPLTGESRPVRKRDCTVKKPALAERENTLFSGTFCLSGRARCVVTETGMHTEMGAIADLLTKAQPVLSPLDKVLSRLAKIISYTVLSVAAALFVVGVLSQRAGILQNLMSAIAVAVAAIPEGMGAVVTVILAMGVQRMSAFRVTCRRLSAVETLGSCTCICSDKTGTLTENRMTVTDVWSHGVHDSIIKLQPKVTFKGEVFPCQMQHNSEYMIGNINTHTLKQILDSNDARRFLALMFLRKYYMKECNACLFKSICGRGCMAKSINDCGNPFVVDGCCQFYKELIVVDILKRLTYN